ncbi:MAG: leucine-rich repeat domain-containing protein [Romboutsia sp.]|nr:leucine-rich repeat domain-containing protein [Romboutsia sp.]
MANLNDTQMSILQKYKKDLRRGDLSRLAKDLTNSIDYSDRCSIIAFLLEHGVDILKALPFLPSWSLSANLRGVVVLEIPGNIETIRNSAIQDCDSIQEIIIEEGVENIEANAIVSNENLRKIILPNSLKSLGEKAFASNPKLQEIFIPDSIRVLPKGLFNNCSEDLIITANFRENKSDRLKCVEGEREWYKQHLKWIKD